jgi:hypothetical protein
MSKGKQKENKRKESTETAPDNAIKNAIKSNTTIAALAMEGATPTQKLVIYCCYGVILLGIIALTVPPYQALKELIALALTVVCLVIVAVFVLSRYRDLSKEPAKIPPGDQQKPPTFKISTLKRRHLRTILQDVRKVAFEFLEQRDTQLLDDNVRANIFLPEYDASGEPDKYKLKIYPSLHLKMDGPELNIIFLPNQGATGNVFASGQPRVAKRLSSGMGDWDDFYNITDKHATTIHPDLKWVISMPLQIAGGKPIGVVNVDGLQCQFSTDVLYECMGKLTLNVMAMSEALASS